MTQHQQAPVLSRDADVWPADLTADEIELLRGGIIHLAIFNEERGAEFAKDANDPRFKRHRAGCRRVAAHHQEELYKIGELAARCGMRNGWPRPHVQGSAMTAHPDSPDGQPGGSHEIEALTVTGTHTERDGRITVRGDEYAALLNAVTERDAMRAALAFYGTWAKWEGNAEAVGRDGRDRRRGGDGMSTGAITLEQAQAVITAHREAEQAHKTLEARQYVGRAYTYRNSYGGDSETWWLYALITGVTDLGTPQGWSFQRTASGEIEITGEKPLYVDRGGSYIEIPIAEFWQAAATLRDTVIARLTPDVARAGALPTPPRPSLPERERTPT